MPMIEVSTNAILSQKNADFNFMRADTMAVVRAETENTANPMGNVSIATIERGQLKKLPIKKIIRARGDSHIQEVLPFFQWRKLLLKIKGTMTTVRNTPQRPMPTGMMVNQIDPPLPNSPFGFPRRSGESFSLRMYKPWMIIRGKAIKKINLYFCI